MMAYCSISAGVLVPEGNRLSPTDIVYLFNDASTNPSVTHHVLSLIDDWEQIEGSDFTDLWKKFATECWLDRATSYAVLVLEGTTPDLEYEVLEYIEELLQTRGQPTAILDRLIVAPLRDPKRPAALAKTALSHNFAATAVLFDAIGDFQPLLRRLVSHWLELPVEDFASIPTTRSRIWNFACSSGLVRKSFGSESRRRFRNLWNRIAFDEAICPTPASRRSLARITSELAHRLFPAEESTPSRWASGADAEGDAQEELLENTKPFENFQVVRRQIDVIAAAIAAAEDSKASKFLRELITEQRRFRGGDDRAVKSLCNVAQRSADLFRTDFERLCLDFALEIRPTDPWTLRQFADHLKRIGEFDAAIDTYKKAASHGDETDSFIGIADVWSERGEFTKAIELYKQIPAWHESPVLRTAIADNLRRLGQFDEADQEYHAIITTEVEIEYSRALAGRADIARKRGNLDEAHRLYMSLADTKDERAQRIFRMTLCDLLKQMGHLEKALVLADQLVREAPFFLQARIQRGCILGILGNHQQALAEIPGEGAPKAFGEWVRSYYRGLLLFKLGRFSDAKRELTEHLVLALDQGDNRATMRLGAAFAYLHTGDLDLAEAELDNIQDVRDFFTQHLREVLSLHLAVAREDRDAIALHSQRLRDAVLLPSMIREAIDSLMGGRIEAAFNAESSLLLAISPELRIAV